MTEDGPELPTGDDAAEIRGSAAPAHPETEGSEHTAGLRIREFDAAIFDLDGVVTRTARVHAASWKRLFDEYLRARADRAGEPFRAFDIEDDYRRYVDGKPRYDGVESFLASRGIELPRGDPADAPDTETVCGLGNRKDRYFHDSLKRDGVEVYDSTVAFIHRLRNRRVGTAMVSSSRNARAVLAAAGLEDLFDNCVDGNEAARLGLKGKPDPDTFLRAAKNLGVAPEHAIMLEDAISGVQAGRAGGFGLVVGVDRTGHADDLKKNGADIVVADLAELHVRVRAGGTFRMVEAVPDAVERFGDIVADLADRRAAVFLDYDGTLTPIVERPDLAVLSDEMRKTVDRLSAACTVAIISGRDRADVQRLVGLDGLVYAGSHGFDIAGPEGLQISHEEGTAYAAVVQRTADRLAKALAPVPGVIVEPKRFTLAVHYRQVADADLRRVEAVVDDVLSGVPELRKTYGKKVYELRPRLDWDKGKAVLWVLRALGLDGPDVLPFYLGDDTTDEDAFAALEGRGVGILVGRPSRETAAGYVVHDPDEVRRFLEDLAVTLEARRDA